MITEWHDESDGEAPQPFAPSFLIGRDAQGHWLAVETHGLAGGLFASQDAARRYAAFETGFRRGAVQLASELVSLKIG